MIDVVQMILWDEVSDYLLDAVPLIILSTQQHVKPSLRSTEELEMRLACFYWLGHTRGADNNAIIAGHLL